MKKKETIIQEQPDNTVEEISTESWFCSRGYTPPSKWDWKLIKKEWNKLKMPKNVVYDPFHVPFDVNNVNHCSYYFFASKRGVGKTTTMLLLGMILFKLYGVVIQYIRQKEDMLRPKFAQELMKTVLDCGYIEKLTEGRWNYAYYYANKWVFCKLSESGKIEEKTAIHFMYELSIDQSFTYKSNYNAPHGDWIIFDEMLGRKYEPNEFIYFMDILSTIIRKRQGVRIILLTNAIDEYSEYFEEFEIEEQLKKLKRGDCDICTSSGGTKIYVEKIDQNDKNAARLNKEYYGFKSPMLYAITGEGDWNVKICKHWDIEDEDAELIDRTHYIKMGLNMVRLELMRSSKYGWHVRVQKATKIYPDSVIYTMDEIEDARFRHSRGYSKVDRFLWDLLAMDKWHYRTNSQKNFVDKYSLIC